MRKIIVTGLFLFIGILSHAQEVEIKNNKVLLDGKEILKYEKINVFQHSFYSLENDDELFMYRFNQNETPQYLEDDYFSIHFLNEKKKIESTQKMLTIAGMGMNSKKSMEKTVKWLLKEKVLTPEGKINPDKVETFYEKYNENITERTVRH